MRGSPPDAVEQQQALRIWKDVRIEWGRPKHAEVGADPAKIDRAVRDFKGAVLTTPAFLRERDAP